MKPIKQLFKVLALLVFTLRLTNFSHASPPIDASSQPPPQGLVTLIKAYNALDDERWGDAWQLFKVAGNFKPEELSRICDHDDRVQSSGLHRSLSFADALARSGRDAEALKLLDNLISTQFGSSTPYALKAMVFMQSNRLDEAAATLSIAPTNGIGSTHCRLLRAYLLIRQNQFGEARKSLDSDWPRLQSCFLAYNIRGFLDVIEGKHGAALKDFESALSFNSDFSPASENILFASMMRTKGMFGLSATNLDFKVKGLFGASGSFDFKSHYDQSTGFRFSLDGNGSFNSDLFKFRSGLFARSDATLEDVRQADKFDLQNVLTSGDVTTGTQPEKTHGSVPALTCPLIIWN